MSTRVTFPALLLAVTAACAPTPAEQAATALGTSTQALHGGLPAWGVELLKSRIVELAEANTTNEVNLTEVRAAMTPALLLLSIHFALHRPADELELTRGTWKQLWTDSDDVRIDAPGVPVVDQNRVYQVVEDGFYYNVSETRLDTPGGPAMFQGFLKGVYDIAWPADEAPAPALGLNVIDLEFADSVARPGPLPQDVPLRDLALAVDAAVATGELPPGTFPTPGPRGVTGKLFNLYIDDEVRFAAGYRDDEPEDVAFFILRRTETAQ